MVNNVTSNGFFALWTKVVDRKIWVIRVLTQVADMTNLIHDFVDLEQLIGLTFCLNMYFNLNLLNGLFNNIISYMKLE